RPRADVAKQDAHEVNGELQDEQIDGQGQDNQVDLVAQIEEGKDQPQQPAGQHGHDDTQVGIAQEIGGGNSQKGAQEHFALKRQVEDAGLVTDDTTQGGQDDRG